MPAVTVTRQEVAQARNDLGAFGKLTGFPMEPWQSGALSLKTRHTVLVSPRQLGKSRSLAVLAVWWAFRKPNQMVLVVSAGDDASKRLLTSVRAVASHPLLHASVEDETKTWVVLSNGSQIRCVPASPAAIRGWSVDLLIVDEASFVPDDLLLSAALPTTMARPDARIVLASTPWGDGGAFYAMAMAGLDESNPDTRSYRWRLQDGWWVVPEVIEAARRTMSPLQFKAEYEGEWVPSADTLFDKEDLLAAVCDFPMTRYGRGMPAYAGLDWGRRQDMNAIVLAALLDDYGMNGRPVIIVPWAEASRRDPDAQIDEIEALSRAWALTVFSEINGVGDMPTFTVAKRLRAQVNEVKTSQVTKEDSYGRIALLLAERSLVLPNFEPLLRQLGTIVGKPASMGHLKIGARLESDHDDLADALAFAVGGMPRHLAEIEVREPPSGIEWMQSAGGVHVPVPFVLTRAEESWLNLYGGVVRCESCKLPNPAAAERCQYCGAAFTARKAVKASAARTEAVPVPNCWTPTLMECPAGHRFDSAYSESCPQCSGRQAGTRTGSRAGLPAALSRALSMRAPG